MTAVIHVRQVNYPESDGKPMGETDDHRQEMVRHIEVLGDFYQGQNVYVSGNLLVYYVPGNPRKYVVPDAFVAKGISPRARRVYKIWLEGKAPDVVIETTSRKTRRKDTVQKPELYAHLGVKEYCSRNRCRPVKVAITLRVMIGKKHWTVISRTLPTLRRLNLPRPRPQAFAGEKPAENYRCCDKRAEKAQLAGK